MDTTHSFVRSCIRNVDNEKYSLTQTATEIKFVSIRYYDKTVWEEKNTASIKKSA